MRLAVPRESTEQALVRIAGATTAVSTANGLSFKPGIGSSLLFQFTERGQQLPTTQDTSPMVTAIRYKRSMRLTIPEARQLAERVMATLGHGAVDAGLIADHL